MKKLFVLFVLLASFAMAQSQLVTLKFSTLLENTAQTGYVMLGDWSRIDSVGLTLAGYGEVGVDSVDVYPGWTGQDGAFYFGTAYTFLAGLNLGAATKGWDNGVGSAADKDAATILTSAVMRGSINALKVIIQPKLNECGTGAGNYVYCIFRIWGIPKGGT